MKESRKNLKLKAKRALLGRYPTAVGAMVLAGVFLVVVIAVIELGFIAAWGVSSGVWDEDTGLIVAIGVLGLLIMVFMILVSLLLPGYLRLYLNICQGREAGVLDIFWGFGHHGGKFFVMGLLFALLCAVLSAPQIVLTAAMVISEEALFPIIFLLLYGIFLGILEVYVVLTYGQVYLVLADNPDIPILEALKESKRLMKGNRGRFFVLGLSFLGWLLILYITLGYAALWLVPYIMCTNIFFYLNLKELSGPAPVSASGGWDLE